MNNGVLMKAIFLDRDGTIIINHDHLHKPEDIRYFPWSKRCIDILKVHGYEIFMITNQSGIARGFFKIDDVYNVNSKIEKDLGVKFKEVCICPHHPNDGCDCRKPNPTNILKMIEKYNIDKNNCYMIGDREADAMAGVNAGINGIFLSDTPCCNEKIRAFSNLLDFLNMGLLID